MSAAILPDLCHLNMKLHSYVFCAKASKAVSKRAANEFVAARRVECIIPNAKQQAPGWMFRVANVRRGIELLQGNDPTGFEKGEHFNQQRFLRGGRQIDQNKSLVNDIICILLQ